MNFFSPRVDLGVLARIHTIELPGRKAKKWAPNSIRFIHPPMGKCLRLRLSVWKFGNGMDLSLRSIHISHVRISTPNCSKNWRLQTPWFGHILVQASECQGCCRAVGPWQSAAGWPACWPRWWLQSPDAPLGDVGSAPRSRRCQSQGCTNTPPYRHLQNTKLEDFFATRCDAQLYSQSISKHSKHLATWNQTNNPGVLDRFHQFLTSSCEFLGQDFKTHLDSLPGPSAAWLRVPSHERPPSWQWLVGPPRKSSEISWNSSESKPSWNEPIVSTQPGTVLWVEQSRPFSAKVLPCSSPTIWISKCRALLTIFIRKMGEPGTSVKTLVKATLSSCHKSLDSTPVRLLPSVGSLFWRVQIRIVKNLCVQNVVPCKKSGSLQISRLNAF